MSDRSAFLEQAGLDPAALPDAEWHGPATAFATDLLAAISTQSIPFLTPQPGYTPLGAVLRQILRAPDLAEEVRQFIGTLIQRDHLIDLTVAAPDPALAALLQAAPAPADATQTTDAQRQVDRYLDAQWLTRCDPRHPGGLPRAAQ